MNPACLSLSFDEDAGRPFPPLSLSALSLFPSPLSPLPLPLSESSLPGLPHMEGLHMGEAGERGRSLSLRPRLRGVGRGPPSVIFWYIFFTPLSAAMAQKTGLNF